MRRPGRGKRNNRGFVLIGTYFLLAVLAIYSGSVTMQTMTQDMAVDRLRERYQALDLAMGTTDQLRENLYATLAGPELMGGTGDAVQALAWLDSVGTGGSTTPAFPNTRTTSLWISLPAVPPDPGTGRTPVWTWVTSVARVPLNSPDPVAPRDVTIYSEATVGSVTKRIQATYRVELGTSDIFRYAYFVNNYGWFTLADPTKRVLINGDVRANGNLDFTGPMSRFYVNGDLFASVNPEMAAAGTLTGNPSQFSGLPQYHQGKTAAFSSSTNAPITQWNPSGQTRARPARQLTLPGQPVIGGGPPKVLPAVMGWDGNEAVAARQFPGQSMQPMPYMGDVSGPTSFYRNLATGHLRVPSSPFGAGTGSKLQYRADTNGDGNYFNDGPSSVKTLTAAYDPTKGPDQVPGNADDGKPLVLLGSTTSPIVIDGPVVVPGDVIIKGVVRGRGTIYAGRNVHVVGEVTYLSGTQPQWPAVERNTSDGRIRRSDTQAPLGRLCPPNDTFTTAGSCPH